MIVQQEDASDVYILKLPCIYIHKQIYNTKSEETGSVVFDLRKYTCDYIVDEASMIGEILKLSFPK